MSALLLVKGGLLHGIFRNRIRSQKAQELQGILAQYARSAAHCNDGVSVCSAAAALHVHLSALTSLLILEGEGTFTETASGETLPVKKGESVFVPAGTGEYTVQGTALKCLRTRV